MVIVTGLDHAVALFGVDVKTNPRSQSFCLGNFPIFKVCFSADIDEVLAVSTHRKVVCICEIRARKLIPVY